ncbi:helix-turn-helix transcriptional regulator [Staphylococcus capitis]|uniref:helix-turn-helix transcriptional regulator n=1 Tax=Staphylococcus capitis TaxID=29388 RepID=UPI00345AAA36
MHDLCKISCISSSETIKLFKRYVGMTPFQYLLHYRLEKCAKQLKLTHNNVTEVAMDCGFSTTSYFIQMFKDKYKVTPKQFQLSH